MKSSFDELGIKLVGISPDTVEQASKMKRALKLSFPILADPDLVATGAFGVRHEVSERAMAGDPKDGRGMRRPLAIPTSVLVDAAGVVRWFDQSTDYRVRSDAPRVLDGVRQALA